MIPLRIRLSGFLSYRDEQEVDLTGADLWMLSGPNGSGKSSVFDAMTFALFGHHRGGATNSGELINKDSENLEAELEFEIDGKAYRARRTLKKKRDGSPASTQSLSQLTNGQWEPVPDTQRKAGFDAWIQQNIGLDYKTFTSSVLLLQGRAEQLINALPKERFEVLAGIVDLERYTHLHELADVERKALKAQVEQLQSRVEAFPIVEIGVLEAARTQITDTDLARKKQVLELERRLTLKAQAEKWEQLQRRIAEFAVREKESLALLSEAEKIETAAKRLRELRGVLPHLDQAIKSQSRIVDTQRKETQLEIDLTAAKENFVAAKAEEDIARAALAQLETTLRQTEAALDATDKQFSATRDALARLDAYDALVRGRDRLTTEIEAIPDSLSQRVAQLIDGIDHLQSVQAALPQLQRIATNRAEMTRVQVESDASEKALKAIEREGKEVANSAAEQEMRFAKVAAERRTADDEAAAASALARQAEEQFQLVTTMQGAKLCRACGQPLTAEHLAEERARRKRTLDEAIAKISATHATAKQLANAVTDAEKLTSALNEKRTKLRSDYSTRSEQVKNLAREAERLQHELDSGFSDLPPWCQEKISAIRPVDWLASTFPQAKDLEELQRQAQQLDIGQRELAAKREQATKLALLRQQLVDAEREVAEQRGKLTGEPATIRQDHARAEAELKAHKEKAIALKGQLSDSRTALDQRAAKRQDLDAVTINTTSELKITRGDRERDQATLENAYAALPESWRAVAKQAKLATRSELKTELERLEANKTEMREAELTDAKTSMAGLKATLAELRSQETDFPPEARHAAQVAEMAVQQARQDLKTFDGTLERLRSALGVLESRQKEREQVESELREVSREANHAKLLAELLDRDHLQLYLIQQAERQIVDFANSVLDRLSSGELRLRLRGEPGTDEREKALDLEALNRVTGKDPIGVAFLSGSQRFRVAVSLALGIGQFASRSHRPIESVIIDEGFGCLDRLGRQAMIQELQNLRGQLKCVLLVSHQEEFADAFAHVYHFELKDGTTVATRELR